MANLACVFCGKKASSKPVELHTCVYLHVCVTTFEKKNAKKKDVCPLIVVFMMYWDGVKWGFPELIIHPDILFTVNCGLVSYFY